MHRASSTGDGGRERPGLVLIPFETGHLSLLTWRDFDVNYTLKLPNFQGVVETIQASGCFGLSVMYEGRLIACGGVVPSPTNGTGYAWMFGSTYLRENAVEFTRELLKWLNAVMNDLNLHRLYTVCVADDKQGREWVKLLGFEEEGTMRQYDINRSDYIMFSKLADDKVNKTDTSAGGA